ncbi:Pol protein [Phytophthora cinnamomi]|uniref:Pol protein n=1 Tax=Phytophthora cinnamomi TaxID=4785 RepID=UPI00355A5D98|nr:Pol protein [Phytophthora cinnamomi]
MSRPALKDDKERYLTYSITVCAATKEQGIEEEVVTEKMPKFIDGGPERACEFVVDASVVICERGVHEGLMQVAFPQDGSV